MAVRAHAAMTVSECYTLGFGGSHGMHEVVHWLHEAASLGSRTAELWYPRVCAAEGATNPILTESPDIRAMEEYLDKAPKDLYLIRRIHYLNHRAMDEARNTPDLIHLVRSLHLPLSTSFPALSIFNPAEIDDLSPLHIASWFGEDALVKELLQRGQIAPDTKSTLGLNAAHFACLGGHLSTLRCLLMHNVPLVPADFHAITPLHLSIFFPAEDLPDAVDLLLDNGCSLEASSSGQIRWEAHDLLIDSGEPLSWAILVRYRLLVQILLPKHSSPDYRWLSIANEHFYWDILEDLLPRFQCDPVISNRFARLQTIDRPFSHWIAHGGDHVVAINKTVHIYSKYQLIGFDDDGSSHLDTIISNAAVEGDFHLIQAILLVSAASYINTSHPVSYPAPSS